MKKDNKKGGNCTEPQHIDPDQENQTKQETSEQACDAAAATETDTAAPECEETQKIAELQESLDKLNDQHLRMLAEYDNYRKRTLQEKSDLIKNGGERVRCDGEVVYDNAVRKEGRCGQDDHGRVDRPAHAHRKERVEELVAQTFLVNLLALAFEVHGLDDLGVQEEVVRHNNRA